VRDTAALHGKNARLTTVGDDVEIDTSAVELLRDPITHMIRNAIDHGIEPSAERMANGKSPVGHITLAAKHEAGTIIIRVSDDGRGLDRAAIGADDRLIFEPGFTTTTEVTDLSGRGVGMDVVRRGIEALRGTISVESEAGVGTTFTIRLPLTLAVIEGFGVAAGGETWIVPMESVVECVELPAGEPRDETSGVLLLRGEIVPYVRVRKLFALQNLSPRPRGEGAASAADEGRHPAGILPSGAPHPAFGREHVLVIQHETRRAGLVVDELFGASQAVIKPLGSYFAAVPGIAGSSILGDGRVALILDTATILRNLEQQENA
jgi:two-component system chemotaxis sensor kinase CheA